MTDEFTLRKVERGDLSAVLAMIRELAEYEHLAHLCTASEAQLAQELCAPGATAEALVALAGEEPVGYAIYFHSFSTFLGRKGLYLEDLYVRPSHRHKGLGCALLTALARIAVERGCARFEWMVLDWNKPAIAIYEKLGARQMGEWRLMRTTGDELRALADME